MTSAAFEEIVDDFELLEEWEDRYRYVIDLGKKLKPFPEEKKLPFTKVDGCASQVWILPTIQESAGEKNFYFLGDSDALIVRGLIALLQTLYNGVPVNQVKKVDVRSEFERLGLHNHLSSQRSNGFFSMVKRIIQLAEMARNSHQ